MKEESMQDPHQAAQGAERPPFCRCEKAIFLVRLIVGAVFLAEGIQKFIYPDSLGVGRFMTIGIPAPEFMAPFVGVVEIVCGALVLVGLATGLAAIPLIIDMLVAISSTKIPFLIKHGFWPMVHEARTDWCMLLGATFLLIAGPGRWSLNDILAKRKLRGDTRP